MAIGSIILVTHNSAECIEACLLSTGLAEGWEVVMVDNASTDSTVEVAQRVSPRTKIVCNQHNSGFAGAVNQGVRIAEGDLLVVLNPDVVAPANSLNHLARALAASGMGAVGGLLTRTDGQPDKGFTLRRFPTLVNALAEVLLLNRLWPNNPWNRRYRCFDLDYSVSQAVEQPAGACLAIKRGAWEDVAGFDEGFFPVWFEDVDFCLRLRQRGWQIGYCADAIFVHSGGHSVNKLSLFQRQLNWYCNLLRYFSKHHSTSQVFCLRIALVIGLLFRSVLSLCGFRPAGVSRGESLFAYGRTAWWCGILGQGVVARYKCAPVGAPT